jgi:hypothetical protein
MPILLCLSKISSLAKSHIYILSLSRNEKRTKDSEGRGDHGHGI